MWNYFNEIDLRLLWDLLCNNNINYLLWNSMENEIIIFYFKNGTKLKMDQYFFTENETKLIFFNLIQNTQGSK